MIGLTLQNRYRIEAELGRGGMGVVYRAYDTLLDRDVAVKVLSQPGLGTEGRARLLREAQAAAKLNHPNVVSVHDAGEFEGSPFIVMELVEGESLHDRRPRAVEEIVQVARQVCAALEHAHAHGIVHRDLKPENILITPDGTAKLMDFGLARSGATRLTMEGALVGTVHYMAPEQALGQAVDHRADLYALGVVLYELAAGCLPFTADDPLAVISQHLHAPAIPPRTVRADLPPTLEAVILRLLAKNPAERFASADEVLRVLGEMETLAQPVRAGAGCHNLPLELTSFIGRERETEEVKRLLASSRLVTLTGAGGSGKTRLAVHVAAQLAQEYVDGVWLVELASLADPGLVPQAVATALGMREEPGRSLLTALREGLRDSDILLLLDNCEHLIDACARLADALMRACPKVRFLVSTREALGIAGEACFQVPSLSLPDARLAVPVGKLRASEAVRLFEERGREALPGFQVTEENGPAVAHVCLRLDGIPLAIELAAARVKTLRVEQIALRLDDRFRLLTGGSRTALPRQQTLRALIDWSYDLLSSPERLVLQRLSTFVGGWALEAAEAVCAGEGVETAEVLDLLTQLVNKSLVVVERVPGAETRYRLLETIRQYARERLLEAGGAEVDQARDRHLDFFVRLAQEADTKLTGSGQAASLRWLEAEHDNLRVALEWSLSSGVRSRACALRLAAALAEFWYRRGHLNEGRRWLERALQSQSGDELARAKAVVASATLAWQQGDYAVAHAQAEAGVALWRKVGDRGGLAHAMHMLGHIRFDQQEYDVARALFSESLDIYQALGDTTSSIPLIGDLGLVACHLGDYETAHARYEESLALYSQAGDRDGIGGISIRLGDLARLRGDYDGAEVLYSGSLEIMREHKATLETASVLHKLGYVARHRGDCARAQWLLAESLVIQREAGNKQGIAECLFGLAGVNGETGQPERGARLFAAAQALLDAVGAPLSPADRVEVERDLAVLHAQLNPAAFASAWAEGSTMFPAQAIAFALEGIGP